MSNDEVDDRGTLWFLSAREQAKCPTRIRHLLLYLPHPRMRIFDGCKGFNLAQQPVAISRTGIGQRNRRARI